MSRHLVVVTPWLPTPPEFGGALRSFHLIRQLSRSHEVTILCPVTAADDTDLDILRALGNVTCVPHPWTPRHPANRTKRTLQARSIASRKSFVELSTWSDALQGVLERLFLTRRVDCVLYESTRTALFRPPRPCPTVIDAHDVEAELLIRVARNTSSDVARALKLGEARKVAQLERRLWRSAEVVVATSERDAAAIASVSGATTRVVPNGTDVDAFMRPEGRAVRQDIVFTGVMRHQPNSDAARWYLDEIYPLVRQRVPNARTVFVGADPPEWLMARASNDVIVTGRVDDIRPWLWSASVAIVPLRSGGGTRLKIFEALAAGVPVVSTSIGAEGIPGVENVTIIANEPQVFATAVSMVMTEPERAASMRENGMQLVRAYDWATISQRMTGAIDDAISLFQQRSDAAESAPLDWSGRLWRRG